MAEGGRAAEAADDADVSAVLNVAFFAVAVFAAPIVHGHDEA
jgi:hypothetical protein